MQIRDFGNKPVPTYIPAKTTLKRCTKDDVLIGRWASVGRICTGMEGAYNVALAKVVIPENFDKKFVTYLLKSELFQRPILDIERSAQDGFNKEDLSEISLPISPAREQRHIAAKLEKLLSRVDATRARLASIPRILKRFRQSVLAAACSGKLTADWRERNNDLESAAQLLTRIRQERVKRYDSERSRATAEGRRPTYNQPALYDLPDVATLSELPNLPEAWLYCRLENLAEVVRGASPRPAGDPRYFGGDIPWITVAEVTKDENIYLTQVRSFVTEEGKRRSRFIKQGTFLLTNSGATLGVPKITKLSGCINDGSVAFVDIPLTSELFLFYFLKTQTEGLRNINQGAAQPNLNTEIIKSIVVPLPPLAEQQEIVRRVEALFKTADALEARYRTANAHVDKLTQSILAKAFRGELVPQDPNDEPASVLLERIKQSKNTGADKKKVTSRIRLPNARNVMR